MYVVGFKDYHVRKRDREHQRKHCGNANRWTRECLFPKARRCQNLIAAVCVMLCIIQLEMIVVLGFTNPTPTLSQLINTAACASPSADCPAGMRNACRVITSSHRDPIRRMTSASGSNTQAVVKGNIQHRCPSHHHIPRSSSCGSPCMSSCHPCDHHRLADHIRSTRRTSLQP